MFTTNETIKGVHGIPQGQINLLRAYLQGAVYCWCNSNQKHDVFYARKAAGRLLKAVLNDDKRVFEVQDGYVKGYRWTGRYRDGSQ